MSMEPESQSTNESQSTKETLIWTAGALALVAVIAVFVAM
jgi:hypothetical protein